MEGGFGDRRRIAGGHLNLGEQLESQLWVRHGKEQMIP